jgi:L-threonylcarbamoyladenylate synthase
MIPPFSKGGTIPPVVTGGMKVLTTLAEAVAVLQAGGVLVYPTETSYAVGCDATNDEAVQRVFTIKGRPLGKGTPVIVPSDLDVADFVLVTDKLRELADRYWPGPLNIVTERAPASPISVHCETVGTQSVRQSSHPVANELARLLGRPLVATSANLSGDAAIYRLDELKDEFVHGEPDAIFDGGDLPVVPASTTVRIVGDELTIMRQGAVSLGL